jgi:hypothetical protein
MLDIICDLPTVVGEVVLYNAVLLSMCGKWTMEVPVKLVMLMINVNVG